MISDLKFEPIVRRTILWIRVAKNKSKRIQNRKDN